MSSASQKKTPLKKGDRIFDLKSSTLYRVIFGDTDQMKIVYHANYLRFFERGRCEFLRDRQLSYSEMEGNGFILPVVDAHCRYKKPATFDDLIRIETTLEKVSRVRVYFTYRILRDHDDVLLCEGETIHAVLDPDGKILRTDAVLKLMPDLLTQPTSSDPSSAIPAA
ncbi:MAG: acyl-CoA thioesterase [Deltaproteobacteria bacterium]|nr:acyl-CoA thioesterase [Deltaproteobacteria bacterium]